MKKLSSSLILFLVIVFLASCSKDVVNQGFPPGSSADKGAKSMAQNDFVGAEKHFARALEMEPENYDVLNYLSYVQLKQSKLKALSQTIAKLKKFHPDRSAGEYYESFTIRSIS